MISACGLPCSIQIQNNLTETHKSESFIQDGKDSSQQLLGDIFLFVWIYLFQRHVQFNVIQYNRSAKDSTFKKIIVFGYCHYCQ